MTSQLPGFFEGTGMPEPGWWEALWPDPAKVLRDVGVTPGMDVVDLCCGDGWFTFPLAGIAHSVIAIDMQSQACIDLLGGFISAHPEVWNEDIGE